ncbi:TetR family transcriptional regulator [Actinocorallia sp. A-T 12471]|uniref:TetR family transcriptional regulator n=1 Tax=Actinocorallia sp. A-T 12471 TaxID=3089813 RepID=UPI0029CFD279|nr:TetR family transcriptional regulator [Actinocorallia sp. A-T 12471]MDX6740737.1 TetR family transcriptional regulator [Actinocorallia sp. A-T 12471]
MSHDFFRAPVTTMTPNQLARRKKLTEAVIDIVSETGPENLQMREVAERSGVALGTAYRYFSSKEHLLAAAWADWHGRLTDRVMAEMSARSGKKPEDTACERVLAFVEREMRAFQRNPNFARLAVNLEASSDPYVSETLEEIAAANHQTMRALMSGVPEHVARPAHVAIASTLGMGLISWTTGRSTLADTLRDIADVTRHVLQNH